MSDRSTPDDASADRADEQAAPGAAGSPSRRGVLAALGGLGVLGGLATVAGGQSAAQRDVVRSDGAWRVDVDGEPGLRLDPPRRIELDDDAFTASGNVTVGHLNGVDEGAVGATVAGGGFYDHADDRTGGNTVHSHFGTVGGGVQNAVGVDGEPDEGTAAAVGGGIANHAGGTASVVAGGARNEAAGLRAAVGGGINNEAAGTAGTVAGGIGNHAESTYATVAGGGGNSASDRYATTGGGRGNHATGESATVAGGHNNSARADRATVGGGYYNKAHGYGSVVPGGKENQADGKYAFAAGYYAKAGGHDGAYVFADSSEEEIEADRDDAAFFQMPVFARAFNTTSSRAAKTDVDPVDPESVLEGVADLDVSTWTFEDDDGRHLGPMAEDFHEIFGLGDDDASIASVDADGVALAAIQGLLARLERATDRVDDLEDELAARDERIADLEGRLAAIEERLPDGATADGAQASP